MIAYACGLILLSSSPHDPPPALTPIAISIFLAMFLVIWVFSNFSYEITSEELIIRHRILGVIPFFTKPIPLRKITEVRRYHWWDLFGLYHYHGGNLFPKPAVLIFVKGYLGNRVYITPTDPDRFISELKSRLEST